jgi:hypothetical protein
MYPRVKSVKPEKNYQLLITFDNGEVKRFNMQPYLNFGIFSEFKDKKYFKQVKVLYGSIACPHGQDVCPDTLYKESV